MDALRHLPLPVAIVSLLTAEAGLAQTPRADFTRSLPQELQFSCARSIDQREAELSEVLSKGMPTDRVAAARELWDGHSRPNARAVIRLPDELPPETAGLAALKRHVGDGLKPTAVARQLRTGDYPWGAWLAFLQPCPEAVPELLAGLDGKPEHRAATVLALGVSRDPRAFAPLVRLLKGGEYKGSGDAAQALGYLGLPEVEPELIAVAAGGAGWPQVKACGALARVGTRAALPTLERVANAKGYTGALDTRGAAMHAVAAIEKREGLGRPDPIGPVARPSVVLNGHTGIVWAVAFAPDGRSLASASDDRTVRVWAVADGTTTSVVRGHARQMTHVAFLPDGKTLAAGGWGDDGAVRLQDAATGKVAARFDTGSTNSLAVSPDGKTVAASGLNAEGSGPGAVRLWDTATGKAVAELAGTTGVLAFSPDGKTLAASGGDGDVQLWDVPGRMATATLRGHTEAVRAAAFSPDGRTVVTGGDWTARTWDVATGKAGWTHRGGSRVRDVAFGPDGRLLAIGEVDGPVRLLDPVAGKVTAVFAGRSPVAFSPSGRQLATGPVDGSAILLWDLPAK